MRELSAIPGGYSAFRVYNSELMQGPYNLEVGKIVEFEIRALNAAGWGEWKEEKLDDPEKEAVNLAPVRTNNPPNGAQCVNSFWDGFNCVNQFGIPVRKQMPANSQSSISIQEPLYKAGQQAVVQECQYLPLPKV